MHTIDRIRIHAPLARVFAAAQDVERWPQILTHYRWVRLLAARPGGALVEMAAWRPFGPLRYPTWWVSEMTVEPERSVIRYRHVRGITTGMEVAWTLTQHGGAVNVTIAHDWDGPPWPFIGPVAASAVIGPVFVHGIASRTLAGLRRHLEAAA